MWMAACVLVHRWAAWSKARTVRVRHARIDRLADAFHKAGALRAEHLARCLPSHDKCTPATPLRAGPVSARKRPRGILHGLTDKLSWSTACINELRCAFASDLQRACMICESAHFPALGKAPPRTGARGWSVLGGRGPVRGRPFGRANRRSSWWTVLAETRPVPRRLRDRPYRVGMYFLIAMCPFPEVG